MPRIILALLIFAAVFPVHALNRSMLHNVSFDELISRYPSPLAVLETMKAVAPFRGKSDEPCLEIGLVSAPVLGANDPAQIQPLETQPGALFFNYFEKCTKKITALGFADESNASKNSEVILGRELSDALLRASGKPDLRAMWNSTPFSSLPADLQNRVTDRAILFLVGPDEVVRYFKYVGEGNVFGRAIPTPVELRQLIIEKLSGGATLLSFYSRTAVLLRLGPALKD